MNCARCLNEELRPQADPRGAVVQRCPRCSGAWLDKSQIYDYAASPQKLYAVIAEAFKRPAASRFLCRVCDVQMAEVAFPAPGPTIDVCRKCGGTWFDKGEIEALLSLSGG